MRFKAVITRKRTRTATVEASDLNSALRKACLKNPGNSEIRVTYANLADDPSYRALIRSRKKTK